MKYPNLKTDMRRINYKSDIQPLLLSLKVDENQITVPDCEFIVRFYIEGYEGRHYDCSHIGGVWSNCEPSEDGTKLVCYINNQRLGIGELCAEFHYISPDRRYSDGSQKSVVIIGSTELGVELVEDNGDAVTEAAIDVTLPFIYRTAYEIAMDHGYTGTADDFYGALASVVGIADAEKKRVTAEITRNANEQERIENEENRLNAESERVNAEAQRVRNEAIRGDAESDRVEQEEDRKAKFQEITEFIATVRANEGNRESNERERQANEDTRITEEAKRVEAEKKRAAEFEQQKLDLAGKIDRSGDEMGGDLIFTDNTGVSFRTSDGGAHTMFNDTDDVAKFTADNGDTFEFKQNETPSKNSSAVVVSANLYDALDMTLDSMGSSLDGDAAYRAEAGDKIFNPDTCKIQRYNSTVGGFEDLCDPIDGKLYANKMTGYIYRWDTKTKKMVFVGGVKAYTKDEADGRFAKLDDATQRVKVKDLEANNSVSAKSMWIGDEGLLLGSDGNGHLTVEQDEVITDVTLNEKLATKADDVAYGVEWNNGQPTGEMQETTVKEATKNTTVATLFLAQSFDALESEVEKKADKTELDTKVSKSDITQSTGTSTTAVMSQKAVSDTINKLKNAGYLYAGIANPTTNPGTPDGPVFYLAFEPGEYSNFSVTINGNGIYIITNTSSTWEAVKAYCSDIEQLKIYSYTNTNLVKTGDNMIDISRCLKGKYFNWNVGRYELLENNTMWCSPFIPVSPSTTYYTEYLHSVLWFDKNYKKLSHIQPATSSVVSPEDAVFAVCNISNVDAYFGLNANPTRTTFWQTLSDACKTNSVFPYSGRYPFSEYKIENGTTTVIKNIYLDVEVEEGYSYSPGIINKDNKYIQIYKKVKDVRATSDNILEIMLLSNAKQIGNSKFYMLTSDKSWAIVCFDELTKNSFNNWDYDGFEFDERVTKGGIWSNFVFSEQLSELSEQLSERFSEVSERFSEVFNAFEHTEKASEVSVNYFEVASAFEPVYTSSTFSGFGFNIGSVDKPFRYLRTKVKVSDWVSNPKSVKQVLVQIRENDGNGLLLFSKRFEINYILPGITKDIFIDLGEELSFSGKSLYLIIRFDSYAVLLKANNSTNPNTDNTGRYFIMGNIDESKRGELVSGNGDSYRSIYFELYSSLTTNLFLTDEQISNIASRIEAPLPESETVDISLPDKIYAIVGDTLQLFFRGIIKAVDPYKYNIVVSCSKGKQYPRYFEYTPTIQDVGQTNFAITVKDNNRKIISTKQCLLVTKNIVASPSKTINVACFGDSLTAGGTWCKEAHRRLVESGGSPVGKGLTNIQFVGSRKNGTTGYFGVGGWTWDSYTTQGRPAYRFQVSGVSSLAVGAVYTNNGNTFTIIEVNVTAGSGNILCSVSSLTPAPTDSGTLTKSSGTGDSTITFSSYSQDTQNPLWDYGANKMTFIPYANTVANGNIDVVYTLLSWNSQTSGKEDFSDVIAKIKIFADTLHSEFSNAKLKIMGIQVPSVNGGMGANYGATGTSYADGYGMVVTALNQNKAYQDFANSEVYKDFVEFVNISSEFDTEYNMPYSETNVNTRSTVKEKRGTNGVHPSIEGYYQIADTVFRNFIANFCQ